MEIAFHGLDTSVGVPGPHGFAVRKLLHSSKEAARVHRIPPRVRHVRVTPLLSGQDEYCMELIWGRKQQEYFFETGWTNSQFRIIGTLDLPVVSKCRSEKDP